MKPLRDVQDRAVKLIRGSVSPVPPGLPTQVVALIAEAYGLGREEAGRDWQAVLQKFCAEVHRSGVAVKISKAFYQLLDDAKPLMPPDLSDDDSEAEAEAAEQRAQFREVHFPGSGPVEMIFPGD